MPTSKWLRRLSPFHWSSREDQTGPPAARHVDEDSGVNPCDSDEIFDESEAVLGDEGPSGKGSGSRGSEQKAPNGRWSNEEWLGALRDCDPDVIKALRNRLARGLLAALERASLRRQVPYRTKALAREAAREALEEILADLDAFRRREPRLFPKDEVSESRFTTWAQKIAVHTAFMKLRQDG